MKDIKTKEENQRAINLLEKQFNQWAKQWEEEYYDTNALVDIASEELYLVQQVMQQYKGFIFEFNENDYGNDDDWFGNQVLSESDFNECNVTENNYGMADCVAFCIKEELVEYIKAL